MSNQLRLLLFIVVISGALCTVQDYVIMSQCAHNKAIHLAAEGKVSVTDIPMTQNITIAGTTDFLATQVFKITLYAKETQMYLCFNNHWKLVGMRKLQETCYFNESIVHGYFEYRSAVDPKRRVGFTHRGKAIGPKKNVTDACYFFTKIEAEQFFHQHTALYASASSTPSSPLKSKSKSKLSSDSTLSPSATTSKKSKSSSKLMQAAATASPSRNSAASLASSSRGSGSGGRSGVRKNSRTSTSNQQQQHGHNSNLSNNNSGSSNSRRGNNNLSSTNNNHRNHQNNNKSSSNSSNNNNTNEQLQQLQQQQVQQLHQVRHHHNDPNVVARRQQHERDQKMRRMRNRPRMTAASKSSQSWATSPKSPSSSSSSSEWTTILSAYSPTSATTSSEEQQYVTGILPTSNRSQSKAYRRKGRRRKTGANSAVNQRQQQLLLDNSSDRQRTRVFKKNFSALDAAGASTRATYSSVSSTVDVTTSGNSESPSPMTPVILDPLYSSDWSPIDPSPTSSTFSRSSTSLDSTMSSSSASSIYTFATDMENPSPSPSSPSSPLESTASNLQDLDNSSPVSVSIDASPTSLLDVAGQSSTSFGVGDETWSLSMIPFEESSPLAATGLELLSSPTPTILAEDVAASVSTTRLDDELNDNGNFLSTFYPKQLKKLSSKHHLQLQIQPQHGSAAVGHERDDNTKGFFPSTSSESESGIYTESSNDSSVNTAMVTDNDRDSDVTVAANYVMSDSSSSSSSYDDVYTSRSSSSTSSVSSSNTDSEPLSAHSTSSTVMAPLASPKNVAKFHEKYSNDDASAIPVLPNNLDNSMTEYQYSTSSSSVRHRNLKLNNYDNKQHSNNNYNLSKNINNSNHSNFKKYFNNNNNSNSNSNGSQKFNRNKTQTKLLSLPPLAAATNLTPSSSATSARTTISTTATFSSTSPLNKLLESTALSSAGSNRHFTINTLHINTNENNNNNDNNNNKLNSHVFGLNSDDDVDNNDNVTNVKNTVDSFGSKNINYNNNNSLLDNSSSSIGSGSGSSSGSGSGSNQQQPVTTSKKYYKKSTQTLLATPFHQLTALIRTNIDADDSRSAGYNAGSDIDIDNLDNISVYTDIDATLPIDGQIGGEDVAPNSSFNSSSSHLANSRMTIVSGYLPTSASPVALPESIRIAKIKINKERSRLRSKKLRRRGIGSS